MRSYHSFSPGVLISAGLVGLLGCHQPRQEDIAAPADVAPSLPNIAIFLTDTVRADHVGAYGHHRNTTPFFDELSRQGFLFENAYTPVSWTRPAVASLFTGVYPQRHGVQMRQDALPDTYPTLAERLRDAGWNTYILNTNPHVTDTWAMTRGFDTAVHLMPQPDELKAGNGASTVLRHLRQMIGKLKEPFFLYVHTIDPHYPFEPPDEDLDALAIDPKNAPSIDRYDGELHYSDRHTRKMVGALDHAGLLENAIVVLLADHGDEFGDHGSTGHGKTLYQEVVRVPLAMRLSPSLQRRAFPGENATCRRVNNNVTLVDVVPTLLELADVDLLGGVDGESMVPLMGCAEGPDTRPLFFSVEKEHASFGAVLVGSSKLIVDRVNGQRRLYLLAENPQEDPMNIGNRPGIRELKDHLGDLLESFEWSIEPGLHVEIAGKDGVKDRRRVIVRLSTEGRFTKVTARSFEAQDYFQLNESGRLLRVDSNLTSFWHRSPKHVWVQDRDELRIQIDPPEASVTVSVDLDGEAASLNQLRFPPSRRARGWPLRLSHARLTNTERLFDRRAAGVYVFKQGSPEPQKVSQVSNEINDALRALGYIQ